MPYREPTGAPEIDALLRTAAVQDMVARQIRYGQTRFAEAVLAALMVAVGVSLLYDGTTFSLASFRVVSSLVGEELAGVTSLGTGAVRLWALHMNGRQNMPVIRIVGCVGGFFFWSAWGIGLWATAPPLVPLAPMAVVMAGAEFFSALRATRDAYVYNSLGLRKGRGTANGPRQ